MAEKKYRYQLEAFWAGAWRRLWGADKRIDLDQYVAQCPDSVQFRIIDTVLEELNERGRRRNQPR